MARFYTFQLESIHFTSDGTSGGTPCKLRILGVESLQTNYAGQTAPSADGAPFSVAFSFSQGKSLQAQVSYLPRTVFEDLVELINGAIENSTTLTAIGTGAEGDFNLEVIPTLPQPFQLSGDFINGILKSVIFNFTTIEV